MSLKLEGDSEDELTVREAKFLEGLGRTGTEVGGLEAAGYTRNSKQAWRLMQRPRVQFAIKQIIANALDAAKTGRIELLQITKESLAEARAEKQYTAVKGLIETLAKFSGEGELLADHTNNKHEVREASEGMKRLLRNLNNDDYFSWERHRKDEILSEYQTMTGIEIPMGEYSTSVNPQQTRSCRYCGYTVKPPESVVEATVEENEEKEK